MTPTFLLAERYAESAVTSVGHSALPGAPIRRPTPRRRPVRWAAARLRTAASRARRAAPARQPHRACSTAA